MRKGSLIFLIALIPLATMFADGDKRIMEGLSMHSAILGQEIKYTIVLPPGYERAKKNYPVVYLLHGLGDNESSWLEYGRIAQIADQAVAEKEIVPMIFVMPQGFRNPTMSMTLQGHSCMKICLLKRAGPLYRQPV